MTDEQWEARAERFPEQPPKTREYYLLRSIFQKHFSSRSAYETVPRVRLGHHFDVHGAGLICKLTYCGISIA